MTMIKKKDVYEIYKFQRRAIIAYLIEELEKIVKYGDFIKRRLILKGLPVNFTTRWLLDGDTLRIIMEINLGELMEELRKELLSSKKSNEMEDINEGG